MKKKYNDKSDTVADWTSKKLKQEARELDDMIYNVDCYGMRDLILLELVMRELDKRGIEAKMSVQFDD